MKTYIKWFVIALFVFLWFTIIGPLCMNARNDITIYIYPIITTFGVGAAIVKIALFVRSFITNHNKETHS
jgi:hypothetical protein